MKSSGIIGRSIMCTMVMAALAATSAANAADDAKDAKSAPSAAKPAAPARPGGQVTRPPAPRWVENFSSFARPENRKGFWAPVKYIPVGDEGSFLTLGGEYRLRYDNFLDNPAFGLNPLKEDDYLQQRAMVHGSLTLGSHFRFFAELADTRTWGKEGSVSTTDQSRTGIQQAFFDFKGGAGPSAWTFRLGRQEFNLGSSRIIGVREAPNTRRSFDGARAMFNLAGASVSAFWSRPVALGPDGFDDDPDPAQIFYGVYATRPLTSAAMQGYSLDMFYLSYNRDRATYSGVSGEEGRDSVGLRLFGSRGAFDLNWEALYQFGDFAGGDISAYAIATETGYTLSDKWMKPRLAVLVDVASGDNRRGDNEVNTFQPMYPRNSWYTLASLTGLSNIRSVYPMLTLRPSESVRIRTGVDLLWRESGNDAVYLANMVVAARTANNTEKRIGTAYMTELNWTPTPSFTFLAQYVHFEADDAVTIAGGDDTNYFTVYGTYRF